MTPGVELCACGVGGAVGIRIAGNGVRWGAGFPVLELEFFHIFAVEISSGQGVIPDRR